MLMRCDICARPAQVALRSSGCAPVTYAACPECRAKCAENIDVAITWYHLEGGTDVSKAYMSRLVAWNNGEYIGEEAILCYYTQHRGELIAELSKDFKLVDDDVPLGDEDQIEWDGDDAASRNLAAFAAARGLEKC